MNIVKLVPGIEIAERKLDWLNGAIAELNRKPKLVIVQFGDSEASTVYVGKKQAKAAEVGIEAEIILFDGNNDVEIKEAQARISDLNQNDDVDGIMVQLPVRGRRPGQKVRELLDTIALAKDVDGLTSASLSQLWAVTNHKQLDFSQGFISATPQAILEVIYWQSGGKDPFDPTNPDHWARVQDYTEGKQLLVVNRSALIGKPLAALGLLVNATVQIAHSKSQNLNELIKSADIVVSAAGKSGLFQLSDFREEQLVIDVGFGELGKGDIAFEPDELESTESESSEFEIAKSLQLTLSPVPGGVGPLTIANLLTNTYISAKLKQD